MEKTKAIFGEYVVSDICEDKYDISNKNEFKTVIKSTVTNIRKISIYIEKSSEDQNGELNIKIRDKNADIVLANHRTDILSLKNGWNIINFPVILGVLDEELEITIKSLAENSVFIGTTRSGMPCIKFIYENLEKESDLLINAQIKELRRINHSRGWKLLLNYYKSKDVILKTFRKLEVLKLIIKNLNIVNIKKGIKYTKNHGFSGLVTKLRSKYAKEDREYQLWVVNNSLGQEELEIQRTTKFPLEPKISIVVPTYNTPKKLLIEMIDSVIDQTYWNWELCVADGNSSSQEVKETLEQYADKYHNVRVEYLSENKGISDNTNEALKLATGDYIALFDHDDLLTPNALFEIVKAINDNPDVDYIYTDEDKVNETASRRFYPHFKQDFAIDTFRSYNYFCHFSVFRKEIMDRLGGFRKGYDGSQDYDIFLRTIEMTDKIIHIPKVVYHWRVHENSTAGNPASKMYAYDSAKKALNDHLKRLGIEGEAIDNDKYLGTYKIKYKINGNPKVSIIIPNKDHIEDLSRCVNSILNRTLYKNYEIIIVENNSDNQDTFEYYKTLEKHKNVRVITYKGEFNYSKINNFAVKQADGELILLLNNDTEVINADWLENMVSYAWRSDVGAVGAKLYYPDSTIQHGGVIVGIVGTAGHAHRFAHREFAGYMIRLGIAHNLSAVTGACLMVKKELYNAVNGLDEEFVVAYNDVDFCLRLREIGKVNVWIPYAELYHYESKSRGSDQTPENIERFNNERNRFETKWETYYINGDPYYNPNLAKDSEDFSIRIDKVY